MPFQYSRDPNVTISHNPIIFNVNSRINAPVILCFGLITEKTKFPNKLLTWLMKRNIPLIFTCTCSRAYSD